MNILGLVPQFAGNAIFAKAPDKGDEEPFEWPWETGPEGLCVVGGKLSIANLYSAYAHGIFPWPHDDYPMLWFSPDERGVVPLKDLQAPKSFLKWLKKSPLEISWNRAFDEVIEGCRWQTRPGQSGTWISDEVVKGYQKFHRAGFAHSIEIWNQGKLAGGLYGVFVEGIFSAESMFHRESNASKLALWHLINVLHEQKFPFLDVQMVTEITAKFGGVLVERKKYLQELQLAQKEYQKRIKKLV